MFLNALKDNKEDEILISISRMFDSLSKGLKYNQQHPIHQFKYLSAQAHWGTKGHFYNSD